MVGGKWCGFSRCAFLVSASLAVPDDLQLQLMTAQRECRHKACDSLTSPASTSALAHCCNSRSAQARARKGCCSAMLMLSPATMRQELQSSHSPRLLRRLRQVKIAATLKH